MRFLFVLTLFSTLFLAWCLSRWTHPDLCFSSTFLEKVVYLHKDHGTESFESCRLSQYLSFQPITSPPLQVKKLVEEAQKLERIKGWWPHRSRPILFVDEIHPQSLLVLNQSVFLGADRKDQMKEALLLSQMFGPTNEFKKNLKLLEPIRWWLMTMGFEESLFTESFTRPEKWAQLYDYFQQLSLAEKHQLLADWPKILKNKPHLFISKEPLGFVKTWLQSVQEEHFNSLAFIQVKRLWEKQLGQIDWGVEGEDLSRVIKATQLWSGYKNVYKPVTFVNEGKLFLPKKNLMITNKTNTIYKNKLQFFCEWPHLNQFLKELKSVKSKFYVVKRCPDQPLSYLSLRLLINGNINGFLADNSDLKFMAFHRGSTLLALKKGNVPPKGYDLPIDQMPWSEIMGWRNQYSKEISYIYGFTPSAIYDGVVRMRL